LDVTRSDREAPPLSRVTWPYRPAVCLKLSSTNSLFGTAVGLVDDVL
jgi:hypothetical protein